MRVISFVTQKGGSGKTTLTFNCAVAADEAGYRTLILDMDPQGTAEAWYQDREADMPRLARIEPSQLEQALSTAKENDFDIVLIDTPGRDQPGIARAIKASVLCIIPCRPTPADMKATPPTVAMIQTLGKPAAFILTQTPPRSFRIKEAEKGLSVLGMVAPVRTVLRNAYQDAQGLGLGVTEFESSGKAAQEIREIWHWINKKLEKISYDQKTHVA